MGAWALDLDGVLWRGDEPIAGAAEAVAALRAAGERVAFVTNNARPTVAGMADKLARHGIEAGDDLITSPMAAGSLLREGQRVVACGGPGVVEAIGAAGAQALDPSTLEPESVEADAVVVGLDPQVDYHRIAVAAAAVRAGATLIATNDDATYPAHGVLLPGAGAIVAAVERAAGTTAAVAGKPHGPMAALVRSVVGPDGVVVGDRADTDGALAAALGWPFALVLSGVTTRADLPVEPTPRWVADDLAALVEERLSARS